MVDGRRERRGGLIRDRVAVILKAIHRIAQRVRPRAETVSRI